MSLREQITEEMRRYECEQRKYWGDRFYPRSAEYCTWWFKRIGCSVADARRELRLMEREGLVVADRSQTNNTRWLLSEKQEQPA